jgi:hypothetical protein
MPRTEWPVSERVKWLRLAAYAFDTIYEGDGEIEVSAKRPEHGTFTAE